MTETEALELIGLLTVFDRRDWSDPQIAAWAAMLQTHRYEPGRKATEHLVANVQPRDWTVPTWRQAYQQATSTEPIALPRPRETSISLEEHVARLEASESREDREELATWRRHRANRGLIGRVL